MVAKKKTIKKNKKSKRKNSIKNKKTGWGEDLVDLLIAFGGIYLFAMLFVFLPIHLVFHPENNQYNSPQDDSSDVGGDGGFIEEDGGIITVTLGDVDEIPCGDFVDEELSYITNHSCLNESMIEIRCYLTYPSEGGEYYRNTSTIKIYPGSMTENELKGVMAHELYHAVQDNCLGLLTEDECGEDTSDQELVEGMATLYQEYRGGKTNIIDLQDWSYRWLVEVLPDESKERVLMRSLNVSMNRTEIMQEAFNTVDGGVLDDE